MTDEEFNKAVADRGRQILADIAEFRQLARVEDAHIIVFARRIAALEVACLDLCDQAALRRK